MATKKQIKIVGCDFNICPCRALKCVLTKKCYECDNKRCPNINKRACVVKTIEEWQRDVLIEETKAHRVRPECNTRNREPKNYEMFSS